MTTQELDNLAAEISAGLTCNHADYAILAARIAVSNLHKETRKVFSGKYKRKEGSDLIGRADIHMYIVNIFYSRLTNIFFNYRCV